MGKRRSNWYIYLLTFLITGVIVFIVSQALLNSFYSSQENNDNTVQEYSGTVFKPDSSYNFTILVTLSEDADSVPLHYITLTYRGDTNSVILMPYLGDSFINGKTLTNHYKNGKEDAVMKALSAATKVNISKYISFTGSTIAEFFDMAGNTTLNVPKKLQYADPETQIITIIESGPQSFTGKQLYTYLSFPDYGVSDVQYPCKVMATAMCAFLNQNFRNLAITPFDQYAHFIINFTRTNITEKDYEQKKQAVVYSFNYSDEICDNYVPYGEATNDGYKISEESFKSVTARITQ